MPLFLPDPMSLRFLLPVKFKSEWLYQVPLAAKIKPKTAPKSRTNQVSLQDDAIRKFCRT